MHQDQDSSSSSTPSVTYQTFLAGMALLIANYPPRGSSPESADALVAAWWLVVGEKTWITAAVFERAVRETLATIRDYLPPVGEFVAICEFARGELQREAEGLPRLALAAPPARQQNAAAREQLRTLVAAHRQRGDLLMLRHREIVLRGQILGFPPSSQELQAYVVREYTAALDANPSPGAAAFLAAAAEGTGEREDGTTTHG